MSETGSDRPLSRRERRLLEMQQEAAETVDVASALPEQPEQWEPVDEETILPAPTDGQVVEIAEGIVIEIDESLIDVPAVDAEGHPLSRREVRRLREEAIEVLRQEKLAELEAEQQAILESESAESDAPDVDENDDAQGLAELIEDPTPDSPELATQALSLEDLRAIEQDAESLSDEQEVDPEQSDSAPESDSEPESDSSTDLLGQLFDAEPTADADEVAQDEEQAFVAESEGEEQGTPEFTAVEEREPTLSDAHPEVEADDEGYTFPDIKPLDVDRPVFDDPTLRTVGTPHTAAGGTGFEDMIERAVADENASVHSGTSSLILPTIPGSESLSGPIGSTGELFVTGSFELPKSIGETGGHAHLQDSVEVDDEMDPVDMLGLTDAYETSEFDSAPVSASKAVSTRSLDKSGITTPEVQHDNKKSMILMGTGGGLILILIGAGIWVAKSGLFG